jgi:endoribonuclease Dicer
MRYFNTYESNEHPRVLGLTASIVNGKVKPNKIEQEILNLERTLRASCETSSDELVGKFATKPKEFVFPYSTREDVSKEEKELHKRLQEEVLTPWQDFLEDCRNTSDVQKVAKSIVKECVETLEVLGASATSRVAEYFLESVTGTSIVVLSILFAERAQEIKAFLPIR